jgi:hypothetical protein
MNQNIFCSKCHRIPSQCCCSSAKELTDEEIANVWNDVRKDAILKSSMNDLQEFARAILQKAREK